MRYIDDIACVGKNDNPFSMESEMSKSSEVKVWYPYGPCQRQYSSRPASLTSPNGLNFTKSVGNATSRLERLRTFLFQNGEMTKTEIITKLFGKNIDNTPIIWGESGIMSGPLPNTVTRGWGSYLFGNAKRHGFIYSRRVGKSVVWGVNGRVKVEMR